MNLQFKGALILIVLLGALYFVTFVFLWLDFLNAKLGKEVWREESSGWNFGPEQHGVTTVAELSQLLAASYGSGAKWNQIQKDDNLHEAELLQLDISKAKTKLGWRPYWDLETAVERTVEWYKSFDSGMDIKQITVEQLSGYNGINI